MSRTPARFTQADVHEALKAPPTGHVYFLLDVDADAFKIGFSKHPYERYKNLCTGSVNDIAFYGSIPGTKDAEHAMHRAFRHLHIRREWYRYCSELLNFIEDLAEDYDPIFPGGPVPMR